MLLNSETTIHRDPPRGLEYVAMIINAAAEGFSLRDLINGAAAAVLLFGAAQWAVSGPLAPVARTLAVPVADDPVLIEVGETAIRVSDARAHAVRTDAAAALVMPTAALLQTGVVDELADQVALAEAARGLGLDRALEVRAEMALAERDILAGAFLNRFIASKMSEAAIIEAYAEAVAEAEAAQEITFRRILVASKAEALSIQEGINNGGSADELARRHSLDIASRGEGGLFRSVRLADLPGAMANAVGDLPLGVASQPVKGARGWYVLTVETRRALRVPPLELMRESLKVELRNRAIAEAIHEARSGLLIREALLSSRSGPLLLPTATMLAARW